MIYLTEEDWSNLIISKLNNEESFKNEFIEFRKIYNMINFFCKKIYQNGKEQQKIFVSTEIIFQKFRICSNFSLFKYSLEELYILLGACLYIGQRAMNILKIKIDNISFLIKQLINKKNPKFNIDIKDLNQKLFQKEYDILTVIGFNIEIDSPYPFLYKLTKYLSKSELNSENFFILLTYIIKDSYILPLSLYFTPNSIIISSLNYLKDKYNLKFINIKEIISLSDYNIDDKEIMQCTSLIGKIEVAINNKKNQNNISHNNLIINKNEYKEEKIKKDPFSNDSSITKVKSCIKMNID